jgi:hypothetical protein
MFSSKQKLEQHLNKKKKCIKEDYVKHFDETNNKEMFKCCHCSKQYSQQAGLSRHKLSCKGQMSEATVNALNDTSFDLNFFGEEEITIKRDVLLKRMSNDKYFMGGNIEGIKTGSRVSNKYSKELVMVAIHNKIFKNPNNYTFYLRNINMTDVDTYQRVGRNKFTVKTIDLCQLYDSIIGATIEALLETIDEIDEFTTVDSDGYETVNHSLYKFLNEYNNNEDKKIRSYFHNEIFKMIVSYKDEFKRIWKKAKLI